MTGGLLELLGASPDVLVAVDWAAAQLGVSAKRVRQALDVLIDAYLVDGDGSGGYGLAPLAREYLAELGVARSEQAHLPITLLSESA
ncbi:hypothetical protein [Micromonospora sicca]|uniref:hypothetical protein n=1 Tax=Micromonospora sicca TaxID=2202420 RepID=UPI0011B715C9|nr:hypothetical protein [Micromonospora sp. 4G51]